MKPMSTLTLRVTRSLMFWVSVIWIISAIGVAAYVKHEIDEAFDQALFDDSLKIDHATQMAASMAHRIDAFWETLRWLFLPMLAFLPVLALIVQSIVKRELKPVQQLTDQIALRGGQNLSPLVAEADFPNELTTIVDSTNRLLERMAITLDAERSLAANAAHELRTPIATARLRLDNALHYALPSEVKLELAAAAVGLDRLTRRTEKLLQLSRAEGSQSLITERVDLVMLANLVVREFEEDASTQARSRLSFHTDIAAVWVLGDIDTLALALRNLVENALRHAPIAQVEVRVFAEKNAIACISVLDTGAGVSDADLALLTQRHARQSKNQTGYGLGLSIVKTIVERHQGALRFASPPAGHAQGFEARIELHR